jgi:hypothetical protein
LLAGGQFGGADHLRQNVFGPWTADSDLAGEAVRALDRFALVGIAENYEATLSGVFTLLGLGEPPRPEIINVTVAKPVSYQELLAMPEICDALSRLTWADQIAYDAASSKLSAKAPPDSRALPPLDCKIALAR